MTLRVYYEEIDDELFPMWILLPVHTNNEYESYTIEAPFERFFPEDFHDELINITVSLGALTKGATTNQFSIHIPTVRRDLISGNHQAEMIDEADNFLIRMVDLEELLQFDVRMYINTSIFNNL